MIFGGSELTTEGNKDEELKVFGNTFLTQHSNNTPPIYTLLLVTGLMSWRQTATRLAQRQSAQRILADVTTGGSWLGGWGLKGQGLRWQSGQTAKTQFMTLPGLPLQPNLPV